jgi:hypothetical protein
MFTYSVGQEEASSHVAILENMTNTPLVYVVLN